MLKKISEAMRRYSHPLTFPFLINAIQERKVARVSRQKRETSMSSIKSDGESVVVEWKNGDERNRVI